MLPNLNKEEFVSIEAWRSSFIELLAAALFVFLGAGSVIVTGSLTGGELTVPRLLTIALAHGLAIAFLAYATANVSGGHMNPAVTIAAVMTKKISWSPGIDVRRRSVGRSDHRSAIALGHESRRSRYQLRSSCAGA
jgi:aquaporin TIP